MIIRKRENKLEVDLGMLDKHLDNFFSYSITGIKERIEIILKTSKIHLNTRKRLKEKLQRDIERLNKSIQDKESDIITLRYSLNAIENFEHKFKENEEIRI